MTDAAGEAMDVGVATQKQRELTQLDVQLPKVTVIIPASREGRGELPTAESGILVVDISQVCLSNSLECSALSVSGAPGWQDRMVLSLQGVRISSLLCSEGNRERSAGSEDLLLVVQ